MNRADLPTPTELGMSATLWNALADRASQRIMARTGSRGLFSTRNNAAVIAVMALDAAIDEWAVGYAERVAAWDAEHGTQLP